MKSAPGQTIIEVLIATVVVAIVMIAVAAALLLSVKNTAQSKYKGLASSRAQEAVEYFRRQRSLLGWTRFFETINAGTFCLNVLPITSEELGELGDGACEAGVALAGTEFKREAWIDVIAANAIRVEIQVSWLDAGVRRNVSLVQEFKESE